MNQRPDNQPISGSNAAGERWANEHSIFYILEMRGSREPRAPASHSFTPRDVLEQFVELFRPIVASLPAGQSTLTDYEFNHGRYLFALGEAPNVPRAIVGVLLFPSTPAQPFRYTVSLLQFVQHSTTANRYEMRLFQLSSTSGGENDRHIDNFAVFFTPLSDREVITVAIDVFYNDLLTYTPAGPRPLTFPRGELRDAAEIVGARAAGRALGPFLSVYQDSYVQLTFRFAESRAMAGGAFFGTVARQMNETILALSVIPFVADYVNGRHVERTSRYNPNTNGGGATTIQGLLRELGEGLSDEYFFAAMSVLANDYGYEINLDRATAARRTLQSGSDDDDGDGDNAALVQTEARGGAVQRNGVVAPFIFGKQDGSSEERDRYMLALRQAARSNNMVLSRSKRRDHAQYAKEREQHMKQFSKHFDDDLRK